MAQNDAALPENVHELRERARDLWGEQWRIEMQVWADDTVDARAIHNKGLTQDGNLRKQRLVIDDDGDAYLEELVVEEEELVDRRPIEPE